MGVVQSYWQLGARVISLAQQTVPLITAAATGSRPHATATGSGAAVSLSGAKKGATGSSGGGGDDILSAMLKLIQLLRGVTSN